jgi:uncharacterized lipoprotein YddW (UPF0748 family)
VKAWKIFLVALVTAAALACTRAAESPPEAPAAPEAARAEAAPEVVEVLAVAPAPRSAPVVPPPRGLWVLAEGSQRVLEHPEKIPVLLADADALGVTDLFVQVYRGGRAWYPSTLADAAPWARVHPEGGSDALAVLIEGAHAKGLRVHAWVNVLSLARNAEAPVLRDLGRDAAIVDQHGRSILDYPDYEVPEPDRRYYRMGTPAVWLDPAVPGVTERLAETFGELLGGHAWDGLHLDYIRYADALPFVPGSRFGVGLMFGFGEPSRARFQQETGLVAPFQSAMGNANAFDDWRREKLTETVAAIANRAREVRPGIAVSAAVIADRERAYLVDMQDWLGWLDAGHLDFTVSMLYTLDPSRWRYGVEALAGLSEERELWAGMGTWLFAKAPERGVAQLRVVQDEHRIGSALFSWDAIRDAPELLTALATEVARDRADARAPAP